MRILSGASDFDVQLGAVEMAMTEEAPQNNGTKTLAKLLNQLNLPTLALILLTGGGNFFATERTSVEQQEKTQSALNEIHDLHVALNGFEARQKEALENQAQILRGQTISLQNQLEVLKKLEQTDSRPN